MAEAVGATIGRSDAAAAVRFDHIAAEFAEPLRTIPNALQRECVTYRDVLNARGMERAKQLLVTKPQSIAEFALRSGYSYQSQFQLAYAGIMRTMPNRCRNAMRMDAG